MSFLAWLAAFVALFTIAGLATWALTPTQPEPAPARTPNRPRCAGPRCHHLGHWLEQHADGEWMWVCAGCRANGLVHGWLRPDQENAS